MTPSPDACPHPRLFIPQGGFAALKRQVEADAPSRRILECLRHKAAQFCTLPPSERVMEGHRLLAVSRTCLERILTLAMAGRIDDEPRFIRRAVDEMLAAAAFTDWNPAHYLDTAEMTLALATGYDWLYDQLSETERDTVAAAILEKGIRPSFIQPEGKTQWWVNGTNNWTQVCHAGMVAGGLALAERDPALAERLVLRAVENVPGVNKAYAPDGAYAEGTMYWDYGTSFQVALIDMLESALGQEYGLADGPGFLASARYICQMTSPDGSKFFDYADSREPRGFKPLLLWFAGRLREPALAASELHRLDAAVARYEAGGMQEGNRLLALALMWHRPSPGAVEEAVSGSAAELGLTRSWRGLGVVPVGIHRTAWDDPRAVCVALKAGSPAAPHGHMDGGNFILDADGVRWASDLGMQEYHSLEKLGVQIWTGHQDADRWKVFRIGSQGHNVPSFNGAKQLITGNAPLVRFVGDDQAAMPHTVADLSTLYADHVARVWRGVGLLRDGRVVLQDEWTASSLAVDLRWQMLTFARVTLDEAHGRVVLRHEDRELVLRVEQPPGVKLTMAVEDKSQPANSYDVPNPGLSALVFNVHTEPGATGALRVVAALPGVAGAAVPEWQELAKWSAAG